VQDLAKRGRPLKEIDKEEFEKLCEIQCTEQEICAWFRVSDKTLSAWCKRTYKDEHIKNFSEAFEKKRNLGKISLRRKQWRLADTSAAMAIFLGKNNLDQRDSFEYVDNSANERLELLLGSIEKNARIRTKQQPNDE
jgi:hypothetical protein